VIAGAVVVGLVLLLPALPGAREVIRPGLVDWTRIGTGGTSRLAVEADVGDYLTAGRDAELLRIRSPEPLLWRGGTLDYFDGARWSSTTQPGQDYGEEISDGVPTRNVVQAVEVLNAETDLLFGGYRMTSVSLTGARERSDASWSSSLPLQQGSDYRVLSEIPQPTEAQLEAAGDAYPAEVREKFLQLPEGRPEILGEIAQSIDRDYNPATPYAAARAVERYLIFDGGFTYNLNVDYSRADRAIEEFLGDGREGFCTQFATLDGPDPARARHPRARRLRRRHRRAGRAERVRRHRQQHAHLGRGVLPRRRLVPRSTRPPASTCRARWRRTPRVPRSRPPPRA
jgi:hypothetical protein